MQARFERTLAQMVERIVKRFTPERIILFGSHAAERAGPDSDVDLLVVMPLKRTKVALELEIHSALCGYRLDKYVAVTTPEDYEWRKAIPGTIERPAAIEDACCMRNAKRVFAVVHEWRAKAENDLLNASHTLTFGRRCPTDTVCWCARSSRISATGNPRRSSAPRPCRRMPNPGIRAWHSLPIPFPISPEAAREDGGSLRMRTRLLERSHQVQDLP